MLDERFEALKTRFRAFCGQEGARLRAHLAGTPDPGLAAMVHGLAGAAGTFGYPEVGDAAIALDDIFVEGRTPAPEALADLADRLERLAAS
jgi:hypothetical protein